MNIGGQKIVPCEQAKNIGVVFDSTLSMENHVSMMTRTLNLHLRNIARIRRYITRDAAETIVHALFTSRLDYGNSLLAGLSASRIRSLQLAQNTAARIICQLSRREHITPALKGLHWLPVAQGIKFKLCVTMFKTEHDLSPGYISDMIVPHVPARALRSEASRLLSVPSSNTNCIW